MGCPCTVRSHIQGRGGGGPSTVRSHVRVRGRGGRCMVKSNASWVLVTREPLVHRIIDCCTDTTENITFLQLRWRAVIISEATTSCIVRFQLTFAGCLRLPSDLSGSFFCKMFGRHILFLGILTDTPVLDYFW